MNATETMESMEKEMRESVHVTTAAKQVVDNLYFIVNKVGYDRRVNDKVVNASVDLMRLLSKEFGTLQPPTNFSTCKTYKIEGKK